MKQRATWVAFALIVFASLAAAQEQYLDVYIAQVRPEKRADFDAITKKIVSANRQNKGDLWLTMETVYGPMNRVTFISTRNSYAEAEQGSTAFDDAIQKTFGKAASEKIYQDYSQCVASTRSELRKRRWDLSSNPPVDGAAMSKMLGESRWLRTNIIQVRPGRGLEFEALLKEIKAAREKNSPDVTTLVSQSEAGQEGSTYYVTMLQKSLGGFDSLTTLAKVLGEEGYAHYLKVGSEIVENTESVINHFLPELSNPPAAVVAAAPDFWTPKAVVAKAAPAKKSVVNASETSKVEEKK
jgi:antibiotic biosynthesis monooxygenase (ABM) superfamily enzyme